MENDKYQKVRNYALKLLSFRPRSQKEIKDKLIQFSIKRGIDISLVDRVILDLTSQNFLNNGEFASWWIEQRHGRKPKGKLAIKRELSEKGVARDLIDRLLVESESSVSEYELAKKLVSKKLQLYKRLPGIEVKKKISDFLFRRGFDWETVKKVIDSVVKKE